MNDRKLIIWGAGNYGRAAYAYYKDNYECALFIDSNPKKWGMLFDGVKVFNPDEIDYSGNDVVIASKHFVDDILDSLQDKKTNTVTVFGITEEKKDFDGDRNILSNEKMDDVIIVHFSGGLGNQLFQYAFYKNALKQHNNVFANKDDCVMAGSRGFALLDVFKNISLGFVDGEFEKNLLGKVADGKYGGHFMINREAFSWGEEISTDRNVLDVEGGIYRGMFQSSYWPDRVRCELLKDLEFNGNNECALFELKQKIEDDKNAVSIHFRRGDYLQERNWYSYGGICTEKYYENAIKYILEKTDNPRFYVFSDDIDFVKQNYNISEATYVEERLFDKYEDWYDMYLMSKCKHNIIANSTFSWWGAWLNTNPTKIVVAPGKWINSYSNRDIYPKDWIIVNNT